MMHKVKLGPLVEIKTGKLDANAEAEDGQYPFFTCSKDNKRINRYSFDGEYVIVAGNGDLNVKYYSGKFDAYQRTYTLKPSPRIDGKFLYHFMSKYVERLREQSIGGVIKYIKLGNLTDALIPLPPLEEQKKIAVILDAADAYRQKTKALIDKYDQLTQSLFLDMFGDPVTNPERLPIIKLGELGKWQSGGTPSRKVSEFFNGEIPWLSSGELEEMYTTDSKEHISENAVNQSAAKIVETGSLLLGMYDTAALKSTISAAPLTCNQAIAFCRLDDNKVNTVYVYKIIQLGREYYRRLQRGVRQKNLNLSMVKDIEILFPSLKLQNQFAERVAQIEKQKQQAEASLVKVEELFSSLLQRAFKGELTS